MVKRSDGTAVVEHDRELIALGHRLYGIVWINPARVSGEPCFHGTRVPVTSLFDHLRGGDSLDVFLDDFEGVKREQVVRLLEIAEEAALSELLPK